MQDVVDALTVLRPVDRSKSNGSDGFVSIEVAPELARDTDATIAAACRLHLRPSERAEPVREAPPPPPRGFRRIAGVDIREAVPVSTSLGSFLYPGTSR